MDKPSTRQLHKVQGYGYCLISDRKLKTVLETYAEELKSDDAWNVLAERFHYRTQVTPEPSLVSLFDLLAMHADLEV